MKTSTHLALLFVNLFATTAFAQLPTTGSEQRITFMLRNTLGYHRMFLMEGPGIKYGFTMNRRETVPCNWPVGSKLYFSKDGETADSLILTITADDAGKTLGTEAEDTHRREDNTKTVASETNTKREEVTIFLRNNRLSVQRIALISYRPDESGNGTSIFRLIPLGIHKAQFPAGTKLYIANQQQVDVVMSGKRIDGNKPFLTLRKQDTYQMFDIFE